MKGVICPECNVPMRQLKSKHGLYWSCPNYKDCGVSIGAHQSTGEPLGVPASIEGREWRIRAHIAFDKLWDCPSGVSRNEAYLWLTKKMKLGKQAHIGEMDVGQCRKVIGLCSICPPKQQQQGEE